MYLNLKTILLGAAVASAIPLPPNGTHNATWSKPRVYPTYFGTIPFRFPTGHPLTHPHNLTHHRETLREAITHLNGTNSTVDVEHHDSAEASGAPLIPFPANGTHNAARSPGIYHPGINVSALQLIEDANKTIELLDELIEYADGADGAVDVERRDAAATAGGLPGFPVPIDFKCLLRCFARFDLGCKC